MKAKIFILLITIHAFNSCKKLVEVDAPRTSTNASNVYASDATAIAVLTGIYTSLSQGLFVTGNRSLSVYGGLSADELTLYRSVSNMQLLSYHRNSLTSTIAGYEYWNTLYQFIFKCNSAIEGLSNSKLRPTVKQQLLGEAKFLRAFFYFYLVNLYGDVPLTITSDYKVNSSISRTNKNEVYKQIVDDLKEAQSFLSSDYLDGSLQAYSGTVERVRPTKAAATAMLARVYLYMADYSNAEEQASSLIANSSMFVLTDLNDVFLKNSLEAIWQLQPVALGWNSPDARLFIIPTKGINKDINPVYLSDFLINSFESTDNRADNWISKYVDTIPDPDLTYYYAFKYKSATLNAPVTEYIMIFRLAEQYLIRAEARAQQGNIAGAQSDLNEIRMRAGLPNTTAANQSDLFKAIQQERQVELFTELGHRWLDLKRWNLVDQVMSIVTPVKSNGGAWQSYQQLYPVPSSDIEKNSLLHQNIGY